MDNLTSHFKKKTKEVIKNVYCVTFFSAASGPVNQQIFNLLVIAFTLDEAIPIAKRTAVEKLGAQEHDLIYKTHLHLDGHLVLKELIEVDVDGSITKADANKLMKELIKNKDKVAVEASILNEAQKKYVLGEIEKKDEKGI